MSDKDMVNRYLCPLSPIPTGMRPAGAPTAPLRAILFDIYGTLFISGSGDIGTAGDPAAQKERIGPLLKEFGIQQDTRSLLTDYFRAIQADHARSRKRGVDYPEVDIRRIWSALLPLDQTTVEDFALRFEMIQNPVWPMPELKKTLIRLSEKGVLLGIISNAQFYTPYLFEWFLGARPPSLGFEPELIFYSYEWGYAKPSPFLFERAASRLAWRGIAPAQCLYLGNDMRNDVVPARAIGFQTALFAGDHRSLRLCEADPGCRNIGPDMVITDLSQLGKIVK